MRANLQDKQILGFLTTFWEMEPSTYFCFKKLLRAAALMVQSFAFPFTESLFQSSFQCPTVASQNCIQTGQCSGQVPGDLPLRFLHEVGNPIRIRGGQRGIPNLSNPGIPTVRFQPLVLNLNKQVKDTPCENLLIQLDILMWLKLSLIWFINSFNPQLTFCHYRFGHQSLTTPPPPFLQLGKRSLLYYM